MLRLEEQLRMAIRLTGGRAAELIADAAGGRGMWWGAGFAFRSSNANPGSPRVGSADPGLSPQPFQGWCVEERDDRVRCSAWLDQGVMGLSAVSRPAWERSVSLRPA